VGISEVIAAIARADGRENGRHSRTSARREAGDRDGIDSDDQRTS
jgi:hypothetical protein